MTQKQEAQNFSAVAADDIVAALTGRSLNYVGLPQNCEEAGPVLSPTVVESVVPAYSGVTPALDALFSAVYPPLNPAFIPGTHAHDALVRKFDTGATRSADAGRPDPEGFLSPLSIDRYCQYMNKNRLQPDGSIRDSDNWQKGIPLPTYMKGLWRHMQHAWTRHRGYVVDDPKAAADIEEDLCAVIFNASGYLHELMVKKQAPAPGIGTTSRLYGITDHG